jgi:spermidine synthase
MQLRPNMERTVVFSATSAFHDIEVVDRGFLRTLSFDRLRQSSMYLDAPFDTDFEYPGYFHLALAIKPDAERTLAVGLGGGTVVKRMWRDYPQMRIDAVEIDAAVVGVARGYFELPQDKRIRVFVDDGRHFLESRHDAYDVVIVDAFDGDVLPPQLGDGGFMATVRDRLAPDGAVVYNFMGAIEGEGSGPFRELLATLRAAWRSVWVFAVDEGVAEKGRTNLILLATDAPLTTAELLGRIAGRVDGLVTVPAFHLFGDDLWSGQAE